VLLRYGHRGYRLHLFLNSSDLYWSTSCPFSATSFTLLGSLLHNFMHVNRTKWVAVNNARYLLDSQLESASWQPAVAPDTRPSQVPVPRSEYVWYVLVCQTLCSVLFYQSKSDALQMCHLLEFQMLLSLICVNVCKICHCGDCH